MSVKEQSEKPCFKLNTQKPKIMAFGPITSWQMVRGMETVIDFIFLGSKFTADGDCSLVIKKMLVTWKESYDKCR